MQNDDPFPIQHRTHSRIERQVRATFLYARGRAKRRYSSIVSACMMISRARSSESAGSPPIQTKAILIKAVKRYEPPRNSPGFPQSPHGPVAGRMAEIGGGPSPAASHFSRMITPCENVRIRFHSASSAREMTNLRAQRGAPFREKFLNWTCLLPASKIYWQKWR